MTIEYDADGRHRRTVDREKSLTVRSASQGFWVTYPFRR
jgi:hypothetical protein